MQEINRHIGPLSLEQIVRFAGAVQDFNPIHYDEDFAHAAGLPGIVAQGPLTYLVALDSLIAANGLTHVGGFQARLKAPVLPGMSLLLSCSIDGKVSLKADGQEALAGTLQTPTGAVQ
jgi:acyl dehydratase